MERITDYKLRLSDVLFNNFVPFWEKFSPDMIYGGFLCGFDRDGELFFEDKSVWQQGRSLWMFSKLYNEFEKSLNGLILLKTVMILLINIVLMKTVICTLKSPVTEDLLLTDVTIFPKPLQLWVMWNTILLQVVKRYAKEQ